MEKWQKILLVREKPINLTKNSVKILNSFYEICTPLLNDDSFTYNVNTNTLQTKNATYTVEFGANGICIKKVSQGEEDCMSFIINEDMHYEYTSSSRNRSYENGQLLSMDLDYKQILNNLMNLLV